MRPLLPPGLIMVAGFVNFTKLGQTNAVRVKADPANIVEAIDAVIAAADSLVKEDATIGDQLIVSLTGILPDEPTPAVIVHAFRASRVMSCRSVQIEAGAALIEMVTEFIDAAAKPKAPPAPALQELRMVH